MVMWESGTNGYMNCYPYTYHIRYIDKIREKVINNGATNSEKTKANELIQDLLAHQRVVACNWVYYMESMGWDQSRYQEWIDKAAGHISEAVPIPILPSSLFIIPRSSFVRRSSFTIHRSSFTIVRHTLPPSIILFFFEN